MRKILLIEDNIGDVELIRRMLGGAEAEYSKTADCLSSGLKLLREEAFDIILLDLGLPDSSGIETLKNIQDRVPELPIIILTGIADEELPAKAISLGAQDYLIKGEITSDLLHRSITYSIERKRVEISLKRLSRQNELILESAGEGILGVDTNGNHTFINNAAAAMLGYTADELIGKNGHVIYHHSRPDGAPYPLEACPVSAAYRDGAEHSGEDRYWRKDGSTFPIEFTSRPIFEGNTITGAVVTFRDITDRKEAEERLRRLNRRTELILATAGEGILELDKDGTIVFLNNAAVEMSGYPIEEITGRNCRVIYHHSRPDGTAYPAEDCPIDEAFRQGAAHYGEEVFWRKDGTSFPVQFTSKPLYEENEIVGAVVTFRDITGRKRAEEALRESEERFRTAFENAATGRLLTGIDGSFIRANKSFCQMLGYSEKEILSLDYASVTHPADHAISREAVRVLVTGEKEIYRFEKRYLHKDGHTVWTSVNTFLFRNPVNEPLYFITDVSDISEGKQAEEELRTSKELGDALNRINSLIFSTLDFSKIMERVIKEAAQAARADLAAVYIPENSSWVARYVYGEPKLAGKHFSEEDIKYSIIAVKERKTVRKNMLTGDDETCRPLVLEYGVKAVLDAPLLAGKEVIGDFALYSCTAGEIFTQAHEDFINKVASSVSLAVKNARLFKSLRESEERFRVMADNIAQFAWIADEKGGTFWYNKQWYDYTGTSLEEMEGWGWQKVLHPDHVRRVLEKISQSFETGTYWEDTFPLRGKDGQYRWFLSRAIPIRDDHGKLLRWFGTNTDITERMQLEEEMKQMAHHDALTGLPNRRLFIDIMKVEREQASRNRKKMAVLFLDLDRFKEVNDSLGHDAGDMLLKETATRLKSLLRKSDTIARIGGDEFNVILAEIVHPEDTADIARNIIASFRKPFHIKGHDLSITTSIGISIYPDDNNDIDTLLKYADIAMYHAKDLGRNGYHFYDHSINVKSLERMQLEGMLQRSLELGEMVIYYQPLVDVRTRRILCAEALVRWRHPEKGLLFPKDFIPSAEETGFINAIDLWSLETVCRQVRIWIDAGNPPVCVTVNLSARQFRDPGLVEKVSSILEKTGTPPDCLDLEITETIAMTDVERSAVQLRKLSDIGVHISIDDFGTGYSSLNYLKRLPIDRLKIDKSFVQDICSDRDDRTIVQAVTAMAHNMKMKVVAEGVETEEQLELLRNTGCDEAQGYLFSEALPAEKFRDLVSAADR